MLMFSGILCGALFAFFIYVLLNKVYVQRSDMMKVMHLQDLMNERQIRMENEHKVIFNTNRYLGHNDIVLADRITKLEENYAKDCSQKVAETICGDISARAEEYMENDQTSVHEE